MTIYSIYHGRFPGERAAALFAALEASSFASAGGSVVLLVPRRLGRSIEDPYKYFGVKSNFRIVYLSTIDVFQIPLLKHIAFPISLFVFSLTTLWYLIGNATTQDAIYSNEALPIFFASLKFPHTTFAVHDFPERHHWFWRTLFQQMENLLATNTWKKREIVKTFNIQPEKIFVEPNAVDLKSFAVHESKEALRKKFGIEGFSTIVLYTGHLYEWKGVDTLARAAKLLPKDVGVIFVGGTPPDIKRFSKTYSLTPNICIMGQRPHTEIPLWQSLADILILPNSGKSMLSSHYTSPMKLFEYMASGKPIIASRISSIAEHLDDTCAVLIPPDQEVELANTIKKLIADPQLCDTLGKLAHMRGENYTWEARAKRILTLWQAEKSIINL